MAVAAAVPMPMASSFSRPSTLASPALPAKARRVRVRAEWERRCLSRRGVGGGLVGLGVHLMMQGGRASAGTLEEEYAKETREVIEQVRSALEMEKSDPKRSTAVAALREASNTWVAKYRREKQLAGKPSFSNIYSVLNAISGHYISFGPTAPIPAKRKARILEEVETAEKALTKGR